MLAAIESQPLDREQFREALLEAIAPVRAENTRFYRVLMSGRCSKSMLQRYALATLYTAELFCATLVELVEHAPDAEARLFMLENLMSEEGIILRRSRGLVRRPEASHPGLARRFARAVGAEGNPLQTVNAIYMGRAMLARGEWVEAVAHILIGQELPFAHAAPIFAGALELNGIAKRDLAFFLAHETADREHGEIAVELVLRHASTREQQERCIAEACAGGQAWLDVHGGLTV